jgi:hypothetical protein
MREKMSVKRPSQQKRDAAYELSRRALIPWTFATASALGVRPWRALEILEKSGGSALAQNASTLAVNRVVAICGGNGGHSYMTQLLPDYGVALAKNPAFAFLRVGQQRVVPGTKNPFAVGPDAPDIFNKWIRVTGGVNETHTKMPTSDNTLPVGNLLPALAALQQNIPTVIPTITIGTAPYGQAPGAPATTSVGSATELAGVFDSAASQSGGLLANSSDASVFSAAYSAMAALNAAAGNPVMQRALTAGNQAAGFLGTNLSTQLAFTNADAQRYSVGAGAPGKWMPLAAGLCTAVKAFSLGLTSMVTLPNPQDDPHGFFGNRTNAAADLQALGGIFTAFFADLAANQGPDGGRLLDNIVVFCFGDTYKNPLVASGWLDGTPNNSNVIFAYGGKYLQPGPFGGFMSDTNTFYGWDPATGAPSTTITSAQTAQPACSAIAYAVAKGDMTKLTNFQPAPCDGIIVKNV